MSKNLNLSAIITSIIFILILLLIPSGFEDAEQFKDAEKCQAKIVSVDNSRIKDMGLIRYGQQVCSIEFVSGRFKGQVTDGWNMLNGSFADDKIFSIGDKAQVLVHYDENEIISANIIDHFRITGEMILALCFAVFVIIFAGSIGFRSMIAFALTVLAIWKLIVPLYLKGIEPIGVGLLVTAFLTFIIMALVYGFDKRLLASFSGAMLGIILTAILSFFCIKGFKLHGALMAHSEALLYAGYENLNLTHIFMSGVFIGASGAIMDLSVDITSAVYEVIKNCPNISRRAAVKSGLAVARTAMGTMTTTLLLAYSGSSIALLMTFMAQGTPIQNILNLNQVSAQISDIIIGSFGLASTAPFTAFLAGILLPKNTDSAPDCRKA